MTNWPNETLTKRKGQENLIKPATSIINMIIGDITFDEDSDNANKQYAQSTALSSTKESNVSLIFEKKDS